MSSLTLVHTRYLILETVRIPIALLSSAFFPAAAMLVFVVPFSRHDPTAATYSTASMVMFAVMTTCLFQYGVGVSADREQTWDAFVRTLPVGAAPRIGGRILSGLAFMVASLLPVIVIAAVGTDASVTGLQLAAAFGAVLVGALPFTFMGLTIGYALSMRAALAVAQILFFPLAFGGGLLNAPGAAPHFIEQIAPYLPTGGAAELIWGAVGTFTPDRKSLIMLGVWTVVSAFAAVWAYRRDENRRFS